MKIKTLPRRRPDAAEGQTIIIKEERREGCFLRAMNFGCATIVLIIIGVLLFIVWGPVLLK